MSSNRILLDGADDSRLTSGFTVRRRGASLAVLNPSGDIAIEMRAGDDDWVTVGTLNATTPALGVYCAGEFRVNAAALAGDERVVYAE